MMYTASQKPKNAATGAYAPFVQPHSIRSAAMAAIAATDAKPPPKSAGSAAANDQARGGTTAFKKRTEGTGFTRNCNHCQQPYTALRPQSKYCLPSCRVRAFRARQKAKRGQGGAA